MEYEHYASAISDINKIEMLSSVHALVKYVVKDHFQNYQGGGGWTY